ncbi:MAG: dihydrodipicolinate synthase family protein [Bryobacterales bacterium]|nr:dihydrodipicolinate synthase family protein [Bryobacteraceae bacterium]MDW8355558.1 dihydrodipicolinate synthase family protein [Bryobacterales bacterium]
MKPPSADRATLPHGVYVAAITPRRQADAALDLAAALELLDFLSEQPVRGIALFGSTGEFVHFGLEERRHLLRLALKRSRVPVAVNVSHSCLDGAVSLAREAASGGAAALLLMPPYFFQYEQEEVAEFYRQFRAKANDGPPLLLYNVPFFTNPLAPATAAELMSCGIAAGIKDSSGDFEYYRELRSLRADAPLHFLAGNDRIFVPLREGGAAGVVSGVACAVPELLVALDRAIVSGRQESKTRLEARLQEFLHAIAPFPVPIGIKEALAERGVKTGPHAVPLGKTASRRLAEFREWFHGWLPEVRREAALA